MLKRTAKLEASAVQELFEGSAMNARKAQHLQLSPAAAARIAMKMACSKICQIHPNTPNSRITFSVPVSDTDYTNICAVSSFP